jgi:L-rhamnose-H+ transport protein
MALSFAVIVGMSASLGCLIPLITAGPGRLLQPAGLVILGGVALTCSGVVLLGAAGKSREEAEESGGRADNRSRAKVTVGLTLCVVAGFLAPMLNFSFAFGSQIREHAVHQGVAPAQAVNAIWAVALAGGFLSNGGYAFLRLYRNGTWSNFWRSGAISQWGLAAAMGILWTGGLLLYGRGASGLGDLGPAIGWPVFQATMIVISSALGIAFGEWHKAEARAFKTNCLGLAILICSIVVLSIGNRM